MPSGAVLPQFNDLLSTGKGKYQGIVIVGVYIRYFTDAAHLVNQGIQNCFRDCFGRAGGFAQGIVSGADPDGTGFPDLSSVMLTATGASDASCKRERSGFMRFCELLCPAGHLQLYQRIGTDIDDRFMACFNMILWQFAVVYQSTLCQVVFPLLGLQQ